MYLLVYSNTIDQHLLTNLILLILIVTILDTFTLTDYTGKTGVSELHICLC